MRVLVVALVLAFATVASAQTDWVPAATYLNDAAHEAQADRLRGWLEAQHIHTVTTCSVGCTISIDRARWAEVLRSMGGYVAQQHLDIAVTVPGTS